MRLTRTTAWIFVMPALVIFLAFTVYPAINGIAISFTDRQGVVGGAFVGLANYARRSPTLPWSRHWSTR